MGRFDLLCTWLQLHGVRAAVESPRFKKAVQNIRLHLPSSPGPPCSQFTSSYRGTHACTQPRTCIFTHTRTLASPPLLLLHPRLLSWQTQAVQCALLLQCPLLCHAGGCAALQGLPACTDGCVCKPWWQARCMVAKKSFAMPCRWVRSIWGPACVQMQAFASCVVAGIPWVGKC